MSRAMRYKQPRAIRRAQELPYTRVGHCCGCRRLEDLPLYRVADGVFRYRCLDCFRAETGRWPI